MGERGEGDRASEAATTAPAGAAAAELGAMDAVAGDADVGIDQAYAAKNEGTGTETSSSSRATSAADDPPAHAEPLDDTAATTAPAGEQAADLGSPEAVAGDPDEAVDDAATLERNP